MAPDSCSRHLQAPAGLPLHDMRGAHETHSSSLRRLKLGLLNLCAVCKGLPQEAVTLVAVVACDDHDSAVRLPC